MERWAAGSLPACVRTKEQYRAEEFLLAFHPHAGRMPAFHPHAGRMPAFHLHADRMPAVRSHAGRMPAVRSYAGRMPAVHSHADRMHAFHSYAGRMPAVHSYAGRMPAFGAHVGGPLSRRPLRAWCVVQLQFSVRLIFGGLITLLFSCVVSGQTITGLVVDGTGAAVMGARVSLEGTATVQTATDTEGRFSLSAPIADGVRLTVNAQGFAPFERELTNNGVRDFTIVLQPTPLAADVTVTITRTETRLGETAASIAVLSRDDLDTSASQTIDDALRQVAGFTLFRRSSSKTANPTTHGANLRGVSGSGASRAAVQFNGLSLNDAFGGWTYWSRVPQIAVEQIEVLRGGASSLFGSGGLSGAVNVVSPRPGVRDILFRAQAAGGSHETYDASLFTAIARSNWAIDFAAETFSTGGYIQVAEAERGVVDTRANSRHSNAIAGVERRFKSGRIFARGNIFDEERENGTSLTNNATYFRQASVSGDVENVSIGRFEVRAFIQSQVYDQTFSSVSADRNAETLTRVQRVPSDAYGGHVFWARSFGEHSLSSSVELREVRGFSEELGFLAGLQTTTTRSGGRESTVTFLAQDMWRINRRATVSLGVRYDRWENRDALAETRALATGILTTTLFPDRNDSAFSPRVAAIIAANDRLSFYGSYSRSFRAPTLNELYRGFRVGNVVTLANENLRAETADTFEGGVTFSGLGKRLAIRTNVYVTTVSDPVVSVTLSSTPNLITRQRQNLGETRSRGLEADIEFAPLPELRLAASYLLVDARITDFPASVALVGNVLPQVAPQLFNMRLNYRLNRRWSFGIQTRMSSGQYEDDANILRLGSYVTVDTTSTIRIKRGLDVFLAAENIFNSRYDIGLTPNRTTAAPASVRLGLRFDLSKQ